MSSFDELMEELSEDELRVLDFNGTRQNELDDMRYSDDEDEPYWEPDSDFL